MPLLHHICFISLFPRHFFPTFSLSSFLFGLLSLSLLFPLQFLFADYSHFSYLLTLAMVRTKNPQIESSTQDKGKRIVQFSRKRRLAGESSGGHQQSVGDKAMAHGRFLDIEFLRYNLPFILDWFNRQGWLATFAHFDGVYVDLVKEFYANIQVNSEGHIASLVRNAIVDASATALNSIFGTIDDGQQCGSRFDGIASAQFDTQDCLRWCYDQQNVHDLDLPKKRKQLCFEAKMAHLVVKTVITPKTASQTTNPHCRPPPLSNQPLPVSPLYGTFSVCQSPSPWL